MRLDYIIQASIASLLAISWEPLQVSSSNREPHPRTCHGTTGAAAADEERTFLGFIGSRFKNAIEDREIKKSIDSLIKAGASNDELFKAGVLPQNYFERLKHEGELVKIPLSKLVANAHAYGNLDILQQTPVYMKFEQYLAFYRSMTRNGVE